MLNKAKGRMFKTVGWTWNPIGGCDHNCKYCYAASMANRFGRTFEPNFREHFLKDKMPEDHSWIFVGSTGDTFCEGVKDEWLEKLFSYIENYEGNNKFLLQTKNPELLFHYLFFSDLDKFTNKIVIGTTFDTNRDTPWSSAPTPVERWFWIRELQDHLDLNYFDHERFLSLEPLSDFDFDTLTYMIAEYRPTAIEIGLENYTHFTTPPPEEKIIRLRDWLDENGFAYIFKENLRHLEGSVSE